jgi:drug/metabolite transporter (DMT)-like permease
MDRNRLLGLLFGTLAALIGGAWQVLTRQATTTVLAPMDLALLRYTIPALLLLPLLRRTGLWPRGAPGTALLVMAVGGGLPFGLVAMTGTRFAPSAHMGVLMAGASPLMAAALAWLLWREKVSGLRAMGLALMATGVLLLGAKGSSVLASGAEVWRGDALFLLAALLWAGYSLAFGRTGLTPWQGAAVVSAWSALLLVPLWVGSVLLGSSRLFAVAPAELLWHALFQGVVAGLFGLWTVSAAIARLGASQAAAFGALAPVVSALGGWWWLRDPISAWDLFAVAAAVLGVLLASGAWPIGRARRPAGR